VEFVMYTGQHWACFETFCHHRWTKQVVALVQDYQSIEELFDAE
jgi:hypothetical protein